MSTAIEAPAPEDFPDGRIPGGKVVAWAFWDWGGAAFNAVATTFVFTVYLTSSSFGDPATISAQLGVWLGLGGLAVFLFAPVTGERSDVSGHRTLWLGVFTALVALSLLAMVFVAPNPAYLPLGLAAVALGTVFFELASVNYNGLLVQVSTPKTIGRVSGFGWSMGYFGGIVLLIILLAAFIFPKASFGGIHYVQWSMLAATIWFVASAIPVFFAVKDGKPAPAPATRAERILTWIPLVLFVRNLVKIWKESRSTFWFLIASAIFRDGLTGVFTFGGVIAAGTFGFSDTLVIVFAIAANVVAGVATVSTGALDDRLGPRRVILISLIGLLVFGVLVFALAGAGAWVFWAFGLPLCLFVGPAQSASRSFLTRLIPEGREGEIFGMYQTTGRAATFIAPLLFALFVTLSGNVQIFGILGILIVIAAGLLLMIPVRSSAAKLSSH
ncbi:MFS transporter [Gryllotalpicola sp.]|uniref:MFS transporter n=1 Tax=Gryllotalpicola sp. TaxID=1932787 RepID=UPI0026145812|nr:MFS transporter [Gryllotalpicola sp.]